MKIRILENYHKLAMPFLVQYLVACLAKQSTLKLKILATRAAVDGGSLVVIGSMRLGA